jgi:hypothetical protein
MPLPDMPLERRLTREFFDPETVLNDMNQRRGRGNLAILAREAEGRGYHLGATEEHVLGYRQRIEATQPLRPPPGIGGRDVRELEFELRVQALTKNQSRDQAALVTTSLSAGGNSATYDAYLEAPEGDFLRSIERVVEGGRVVETSSWWTAFVRCLHSKCVNICINALVTCPHGTWAAYLGCVLARCGGCGARCAGCSSCDCSWWCKWGVGCCDR